MPKIASIQPPQVCSVTFSLSFTIPRSQSPCLFSFYLPLSHHFSSLFFLFHSFHFHSLCVSLSLKTLILILEFCFSHPHMFFLSQLLSSIPPSVHSFNSLSSVSSLPLSSLLHSLIHWVYFYLNVCGSKKVEGKKFHNILTCLDF